MNREVKPWMVWLGRVLLRLLGWQAEGQPPDAPKYVCVVAPHTSNWDFVYCVLGSFVLGVPGSWFGKASLFTGPLGPLMRWLGGIPVDRSRPQGLVEQIVAAFDTRERLVFVVTPEGTRKRVPHWRAGFYEIARGAGVPIALCYADYRRRRCGFGPLVHPTGDRAADMAQIAAFYGTVAARYPEAVGPIRLREE
jgi:1-acyl-sn-glycerol-3-phosphate acyltransferase